MVKVNPFKSSAALLATMVLPAVVPKGPLPALPAAPSCSVPVFICVTPEKLLSPANVKIPAPDLVMPPDPLMTELMSKSELDPPFATIKFLLDAPIEMVGLIIAAVGFAKLLIAPFKLIVPEPLMVVPFTKIAFTEISLTPISKVPFKTRNELLMVIGEASETVPAVLLISKFSTTDGSPSPTD